MEGSRLHAVEERSGLGWHDLTGGRLAQDMRGIGEATHVDVIPVYGHDSLMSPDRNLPLDDVFLNLFSKIRIGDR